MKHPVMNEFYGACAMRTNLSLEELAVIIADQLFGGRRLGGREKSIYEEIPAVFINDPILGLLVVLSEGKNDGRNGNWFVLHVSPWGDLDRYCYRNRIFEKRIILDGYLYHLLKFGLQRYPQVEILEPESREDTKYLFRLAERVVHRIESQLNENKELTGLMSFQESVIRGSSLMIVFSNVKCKIVCSLSMHPLDMPWAFQVEVVFEHGPRVELHKWKAEKTGHLEVPYEVAPLVFDDPEGRGGPVGRIIANDIIAFFKEIKSTGH
ncbi:hypothetical protein [Chitinophaga ginsengisoli]|uniref:Uncharacterized protein n=1 Tax=Chitinophaga ginsengisoli TaxID=363837 RepID=A0A2P8GLR7_9BACT|nr:hypothetical protein [Chitinophaga ginsengisoli]PSL34900.1 hypothetical protein CLV42_102474 [Chitinophaga ginsengisoli]